jgi:hypothetical protein
MQLNISLVTGFEFVRMYIQKPYKKCLLLPKIVNLKTDVKLLLFVIAFFFKNSLHNKGSINLQAQTLAVFMNIRK